ncbi:CoA-transferase [Providencia vermicola]|uniref:CoA-transferase n=1 Tax=Providencia vermicola TaxID=333965 RepID=UPI00220C47BE|nr:hypothetical protein NFC79_17930 [Providencia stuartii]
MDYFRDGMSVMYSGFMGIGTPPTCISLILECGIKNLTLIGCDTSLLNTVILPSQKNETWYGGAMGLVTGAKM